jgi:hypothetical protein
VTYTGPNNAIFTGTFTAFGEIGGEAFGSPDFEVWAWQAIGPFNTGNCARNTPGPCSPTNDQVLGSITDGILLLTMSISGSCGEGIQGSPCPGFGLSPLGSFEIDIPSANSGDLFLTPTPLPAALPLFAGGLGVIGLLGWRRKQKAATV